MLPRRSRQEVVGQRGEVLISILLTRYIYANHLHAYALENYRFKTSYGSCEIDHVFICKKGVFVIEVKNWAGNVYGSLESTVWTHTFFKAGKIQKITGPNPVIQNRTHANQLAKLFNKDVPIYSLVVFIKTNVKPLRIPNVIGVNDFIPYLDRVQIIGKGLSDLDIDCLHQVLLAYRKIDNVSSEKHIENVKKIHR